jgi:hypothetical protein
MRKPIVMGLFAATLAAAIVGSPPSGAGTAANSSAARSPGHFSPNVDNPWFPLKPGTTLVYGGTKDGKKAHVIYAVTKQVQKINGVPCRVVLDRLYLNGTLAETTRDYYTQDSKGNVWYFGEDTAKLDPHGNMISTDGTWHAGEAGAVPGIFVAATPKVGDSYRQEYYKGHAEDHFKILDLSTRVKVPYRSFKHALLTKEWTPLEPGVVDHKFWVRGIGEVKEVSVKGPLEKLVLIDVRTH